MKKFIYYTEVASTNYIMLAIMDYLQSPKTKPDRRPWLKTRELRQGRDYIMYNNPPPDDCCIRWSETYHLDSCKMDVLENCEYKEVNNSEFVIYAIERLE